MKFSLGVTIHNKEAWIAEYLDTWLANLSGKHEVEVIAAFDACTDRSQEMVEYVMAGYPYIGYTPLVTPDIFEIRCNNLELSHATGDVFVAIQDDNAIYDIGWDATLADIMTTPPTIGAIGLLSGVRMHPNFNFDRMECYRPHKDERAWVHGINKDAYPLAVYQVDVINRPFAVSTALLRHYGGLDEAYCPMDYDDADLSFKLLRDGYTNLYVPFDLLNICAKKETISQAQIARNYMHGEAIARSRWGQFIAERESSVQTLYPLKATDEGLVLA